MQLPQDMSVYRTFRPFVEDQKPSATTMLSSVKFHACIVVVDDVAALKLGKSQYTILAACLPSTGSKNTHPPR